MASWLRDLGERGHFCQRDVRKETVEAYTSGQASQEFERAHTPTHTHAISPSLSLSLACTRTKGRSPRARARTGLEVFCETQRSLDEALSCAVVPPSP